MKAKWAKRTNGGARGSLPSAGKEGRVRFFGLSFSSEKRKIDTFGTIFIDGVAFNAIKVSLTTPINVL